MIQRALFVSAVLLFLNAAAACPTEYWDESRFLLSQSGSSFAPGEKPGRPMPALPGYSYPFELAEIASFLSAWQVSDSLSADFGGMREGECCGLEDIIETDNTQEAIFVWSRYGQVTGDTDRYRPNVYAAWTYVGNHPAYLEEGVESPYYRIHNCGWALVASRIFTEVYNDSSRMAYADSCAFYIAATKDSLVFDDFSFYGRLHPMVAGWAAGTLYRYGMWAGAVDYADTALVIGARVADWVDSNSARRLSDEVWAMSSGTKMWGVVNSVVADNPAGWSGWLAVFAESLQVYQDPSTWNDWNNSWNVWYANAYGSIGEALSDPFYLGIHRRLTDTLLLEDGDADGGVPANTLHPDTMDQTWVSSYLGAMGIEHLLDSLPGDDVGPVAFVSPRSDMIIPVGDSIQVRVTAVNYGMASQSGVPVEVSGPFSGSTVVDLPVASLDTALFSGFWVPAVDSVYELVSYTLLSADEDPSNDTARVSVTVLPLVTVTGSVKDSATGEGIQATLRFLRTGYPGDTLWDSTSTDTSGNYTVEVVTGLYDVGVAPELPYPARTLRGVDVPEDSSVVIDLRLSPATLLLVDDDEGKDYETYYTSVLDTLAVTYIHWDVSVSGEFPMSLVGLFGSPIVIWFTGDALSNTITPADMESLRTMLDSGGNLFVTGQNLGQEIDTTSFLSDYIRASFLLPTTNDHTLYGVTGDPIGDGLDVLTAGSPGAGNQISQDVIAPLAGADSVLMYSPLDCAATRYDSGTYKVVYFGFGFEGVASRPAQGYATSLELLRRILYWFDPDIVAVREEIEGLAVRGLRRSWLVAAPNPFGSRVVLSFGNPLPDERASLSIYDLSGRLVKSLWRGSGNRAASETRVAWDGTDGSGREVPSGVYFVRLDLEEKTISGKLVMLR